MAGFFSFLAFLFSLEQIEAFPLLASRGFDTDSWNNLKK